MEMICNPNNDNHQNQPIFTGVLYNHYESPDGFGFDIGQRDDPIMDDESLENYNINIKA